MKRALPAPQMTAEQARALDSARILARQIGARLARDELARRREAEATR